MANISSDFAEIGGGSGFGFGGSGGFLGGLLFGALLGNKRGGLFGGGDCDTPAASPAFVYQTGVLAGEQAKYRDIVDATSSLTQTMRNGFDVTGAAIGNVKDQVWNASALSTQEHAAILRSICESEYKALLQSKDLSAQVAAGNCDVKRTVETQTDRVVALLNAKTEQDLRDRLNEVQRERDLLMTGNFPISQPAHVHRHHDCSPDHANQINIINQNVQALGSIVGQQADALNKVIAALAAKAA